MAIPTITLADSILLPDGGGPSAGGALILTLQPTSGTVVDGANHHLVGGANVYPIPAGGAMSIAVVPNDAITIDGTLGGSWYEAVQTLIDGTNRAVTVRQKWQFASSPSTQDFADITYLDNPTFLVQPLAVYTTAGRPAAVAGNSRSLYIVSDPGQPSRLEIILLNSDGVTYSYVSIVEALL